MIVGALEGFRISFCPGTLRRSHLGGRVASGFQFRTQNLKCVRASVPVRTRKQQKNNSASLVVHACLRPIWVQLHIDALDQGSTASTTAQGCHGHIAANK